MSSLFFGDIDQGLSEPNYDIRIHCNNPNPVKCRFPWCIKVCGKPPIYTILNNRINIYYHPTGVDIRGKVYFIRKNKLSIIPFPTMACWSTKASFEKIHEWPRSIKGKKLNEKKVTNDHDSPCFVNLRLISHHRILDKGKRWNGRNSPTGKIYLAYGLSKYYPANS